MLSNHPPFVRNPPFAGFGFSMRSLCYVTFLAIFSINIHFCASVRLLAENPNVQPADAPAPVPPAGLPANILASIPANLPANVPPEMLANVPPEMLAKLPANIPPEMLAKLPANIPPETLANIQASEGQLPTNIPPEVLADLPAMQGQLPANLPPEALAGLAAAAAKQPVQPGADQNAASGVPPEVLASLAAAAAKQPGQPGAGNAASGLPAGIPQIPKMLDLSGLADISFPPMPSGPKMPEVPHNISLFGYEVPIPKFINKMIDESKEGKQAS